MSYTQAAREAHYIAQQNVAGGTGQPYQSPGDNPLLSSGGGLGTGIGLGDQINRQWGGGINGATTLAGSALQTIAMKDMVIAAQAKEIASLEHRLLRAQTDAMAAQLEPEGAARLAIQAMPRLGERMLRKLVETATEALRRLERDAGVIRAIRVRGDHDPRLL